MRHRTLIRLLRQIVLVWLAVDWAVPGMAESIREQALRAVAERNDAAAIDLLEQAVAEEEDTEARAELQLLLAHFYRRVERADDALAVLRVLEVTRPQLYVSFPEQRIATSVWTELAGVHDMRGEPNLAIACRERLLETFPRASTVTMEVLEARRELAAMGSLTAPPMVLAGPGWWFVASRAVASARRLLVPAAKLMEALGGECAAGEDGQAVTLTPPEGPAIQMRAGSPVALVGGEERTMDVAPEVIEGELWVPLRFAAEALGHAIEWEAAPRIAWVRVQ